MMLRRSGVETSRFTAGSVRSAAVSKAKAMAVPIACIMARAGWSQESTFARYYDRPLTEVGDTFQDVILA
ncbi:hypothetical protein E2C01_079621 [Portunus trituberculatus]|uniref:Tyr recombinase domain-containing protein n=1 Tax=Portunus trituberculatus TaxID=210409 RepID=A0A5B7IHE0_PORTR|nr:hypothetical protein [Portunus trituberculatus]